MLDIYCVIEINRMLPRRINDVGNSRLVDQLAVVITNVGRQEHGFSLGVVPGDVTDDTREALNGMRSLDVALGWVVQVFGRHGGLFFVGDLNRRGPKRRGVGWIRVR